MVFYDGLENPLGGLKSGDKIVFNFSAGVIMFFRGTVCMHREGGDFAYHVGRISTQTFCSFAQVIADFANLELGEKDGRSEGQLSFTLIKRPKKRRS